MFGLIKEMFIPELTSTVNVNHRAIRNLWFNLLLLIYFLINTVKNYITTLHYMVKLDRCVQSCNILNDFSNKVCVPSKTEDLNPGLFQHDYRNKWIENINKTCIMWM